jgi:hypothetical protein
MIPILILLIISKNIIDKTSKTILKRMKEKVQHDMTVTNKTSDVITNIIDKVANNNTNTTCTDKLILISILIRLLLIIRILLEFI